MATIKLLLRCVPGPQRAAGHRLPQVDHQRERPVVVPGPGLRDQRFDPLPQRDLLSLEAVEVPLPRRDARFLRAAARLLALAPSSPVIAAAGGAMEALHSNEAATLLATVRRSPQDWDGWLVLRCTARWTGCPSTATRAGGW